MSPERGACLRSWFNGIRCSDAMKEFLNDLGKCLGHAVEPTESYPFSGKPSADASAESKPSGSGSGQVDIPETAEQQLDPVRQAAKHGYKENAVITPTRQTRLGKSSTWLTSSTTFAA